MNILPREHFPKFMHFPSSVQQYLNLRYHITFYNQIYLTSCKVIALEKKLAYGLILKENAIMGNIAYDFLKPIPYQNSPLSQLSPGRLDAQL